MPAQRAQKHMLSICVRAVGCVAKYWVSVSGKHLIRRRVDWPTGSYEPRAKDNIHVSMSSIDLILLFAHLSLPTLLIEYTIDFVAIQLGRRPFIYKKYFFHYFGHQFTPILLASATTTDNARALVRFD
jgi:hypothetical protein